MYKSFASLVEFIPKYFPLFDAILNGIVFLVYFSDHSWLVCRNATDFCVLILYPATFLNLFISSKSFFFVKYLGFSTYKTVPSVNRDNFILPFQFGCLFFLSFPFFQFASARTSSTMLNGSGESGYSCPVHDLREKAFRFLPLSMMLAVGLSYMAFIMLRQFPCILCLLSVFIMIGC